MMEFMFILHNISKSLAKTLMKIYPNYPKEDDLGLWEIFRQDRYTQSSVQEQNRIKLQSAQFTYDYEKQICFFDKHFPNIFSYNEFYKKSILSLGCFTGGRLVYWTERYGFNEARGIDINPIFAEAGKSFAKSKGVNAAFDTGFAENLPYDPNYFDFVVSFDVLEHVQNIEQVIQEVFRVLKPGGKFLAVFPQFFQPLESHLGLATKMPALQWFFSGKNLTEAYYEILKEREKEAYWYVRENPKLAKWERLPSLNGITVTRFRRIIYATKGWSILHWKKKPILSDGKRANTLTYRLLRYLFVLPARLSILEELFLGRICCCLLKKEVSRDLGQ